ncbi:MAG: VCBS repeat-containing protein, partial [Planctomycetes bacterium]|nr:VCBS repeat-containing protein [Planctomycetota bacterium]
MLEFRVTVRRLLIFALLSVVGSAQVAPSFAPETCLTHLATAAVSDLADFDQDGDLDLLVIEPFTNQARIFSNVGAMPWPSGVVMTTAAGPGGARAGDFDGDGDIDFVVRCSQSQISVFLQNGAGFLRTDQATGIVSSDTSIDVIDWEGDGDLDLLVSLDFVLLNDGSGNFATASPIGFLQIGNPPVLSFLRDLDGDGDTDYVLRKTAITSSGLVTQLVVVQASPNGLLPTVVVPDIGQIARIGVGDFDGDGDLDLVVVSTANNAMTGTSTAILQPWIQVSGFRFLPGPRQEIPGVVIGASPDLKVVDQDGDGRDDCWFIVVTRSGTMVTSDLRLFLGARSGTFVDSGSTLTFVNPQSRDIHAIRDLDADGRPDILST